MSLSYEDLEDRTRGHGLTAAGVPLNAPETLAEGEFNRFYVRGLCACALDEGINEVQVYRGKAVRSPRPQSQALIRRILLLSAQEVIRAIIGQRVAEQVQTNL